MVPSRQTIWLSNKDMKVEKAEQIRNSVCKAIVPASTPFWKFRKEANTEVERTEESSVMYWRSTATKKDFILYPKNVQLAVFSFWIWAQCMQ